jgi:DNA transposition AAA+ family ATPase
MQTENKTQIQSLLSDYVETYGSQKRAVDSLKAVSEATIIGIMKGKFDGISDEMFRNIGKQVGWTEYVANSELKLVETAAFDTFTSYYGYAKDYGTMYMLVADCGTGKSYAAKWFIRNVKGTSMIVCQKHWSRKWFLRKILESINKNHEGMGVTELMDYLVEQLRRMEKPLIIFDEVHKLSDDNFLFFIELFNEVPGCGLVLQGNKSLLQKMTKNRNNLRLGFEDIYSRAGSRYITPAPEKKEVLQKLCKANGIAEPVQVNEVVNGYDGDLRRIQRLILKNQISNVA